MNCISAHHPRTSVVRWTGLLLGVLGALLCVTCLSLHAKTLDNALINGLASDDSDKRIETIDQLGVIASPESFKILNALNADQLQATPDGKVLLVDDQSVAHDPLTGAVEPLPDGSDSVQINNRVRRHIESALAASRLFSNDINVRLKAAQDMQASPEPEQRPLMARALAGEKDERVAEPLRMAARDRRSTQSNACCAHAGSAGLERQQQRVVGVDAKRHACQESRRQLHRARS